MSSVAAGSRTKPVAIATGALVITPRRWPIRWKLIAIILSLTLFGLSVVFAGMTVNNYLLFKRSLERDMLVLAEILGNNSRAALLFNDTAAATEILSALGAKQRVMRAVLYDAGNRPFAHYWRADTGPGDAPDPSAGERSEFKARSYEIVHDIVMDGIPIGRLYIESDLSAWRESLHNYVAVFVMLAVLTTGLTLLLALILQRVITAPIHHLVDTARQVSQRRDYAIRATKTTEDELGVLVDGINDMLTEIQDRDAELVESHLMLERRVAERTEELEFTNERLNKEVLERADAEARFRAVAETANDAIVSADQGSNVTFFNPAAERMFGYPSSTLVGQPLTRLMPERFRADHTAGFARFLATRERRMVGRTVELVGLRRNGEEFPIDLSLSTWEVNGRIYFTAIVRDIGERKQAETSIRELNASLTSRATELEVVNKELEAFSYSVSHDLRAPLRAIDGFSKAVLEGYTQQLDAQGQDYLQRVRAASQRMGNLIDDLLRLSRLSRSDMRPARVDLSAVAEDLLSEYRNRDPQRQVSAVIEPGLIAYADPALIRVVLENLLGNAWKFTGRRPDAVIEFGRTEKDGFDCFFVKDNGAGFDMAYAGKLFGAFQRLHGHADFEGTGIGLATVQRVVHRHGGRVWAEAETDRGAVFYFTLP